jgi:hypothetical protein
MLPSNGTVFTEPLPRNGHFLQSRRLATGPYGTTYMDTDVGKRNILGQFRRKEQAPEVLVCYVVMAL